MSRESVEGKRIAIFGATSKLGSSTATQAIQEGASITAFARSKDKLKKLREKGANVVVGDITDGFAVRRALEDGSFDATINFAAVFNQSENPNSSWDVNVNGESHVLHASKEAGIPRHVFISSIATDIKGPNAYKDTKLKAEDLIKKTDIDWIILRYANVLGSSDLGDLWNKPFLTRDMLGKTLGLSKIPFKNEAPFPYLGVNTAVESALSAVTAEPKKVITVLDGFTTIDKYLLAMSQLNGIDRYVSIPAFAMVPTIAVLNTAANMMGKNFPISSGALDMIVNMPSYTTTQMRSVLGVDPQSFSDILHRKTI